MSMFDVCSNRDFAVSPVVNFYYCVAIISAIQAWTHFSFARCLVGWYVNKELERYGRNQSWANPSTILNWPERTEEDHDYIWVSSDLNCELLHYNSVCKNMNQFFSWHASHSFLPFHRQLRVSYFSYTEHISSLNYDTQFITYTWVIWMQSSRCVSNLVK